MKAGFLDKLIERIRRIQPEEVQNYLARLAHEKGFLERIFDALQEGVIVTDTQGKIEFINASAAQLFGVPDPEDAAGEPIDDILRGLSWNSLRSSESTVSRDIEVFYPQHRFLNFYVAPLYLDKPVPGLTTVIQDLVAFAVILRDITEERRSTERTIESEKLSALTMLAAGVAHEIGNPLNSLNIHLQLIEREAGKLDGAKRAKLQESVQVARGEVNRLDSITSQFLRAIRPSRPQLRPENVNTIVEETVRFFTPEIQDCDIVVEQELRSDLPLLQLDRDQMKQAFYNVIKNSLEAMKRHGTLRIRTDVDDTHIIVSFVDTGSGMSAENLSRVFEPYFTTKPSGTGLGLLIVRRIVREHGGELSVESSDGKGLTLAIRLPYIDKRVRMLEAGAANKKAHS